MRTLALLLLASVAFAVELTPRWTAPSETTVILDIDRSATSAGDVLKGGGGIDERIAIIYGEKVDKVEAGRPVRLRRKYARYQTVSSSRFAGKKVAGETEKHALMGQVVLFERKGGVLKPARPVGDDEAILGVDWEELLPGKPVRVGESWVTEDAEQLGRIIGTSSATVKGTFTKYDEKSGNATVKLEAEHFAENGRARLEGTMTFSTKEGKVTKLSLKGEAVIKDKEGEQTIQYGIKYARRPKSKK